jgi:SAM-dependent methyltransferase
VLKHVWWACSACGNAVRERRERHLGDRLPWAPRSIRTDRAVVAEPERALFRGLGASYADEAPREVARLDALGVDRTGAILDVGGGPGHVALALADRARRVVMTDYARHVVEHARDLGVGAVRFDFGGDPLQDVVSGPFDLFLARYCLNYTTDLPKLARGITAVAAQRATFVLGGFVVPTLGACLTSALEDAGPVALWEPDHVERVFAAEGWLAVRRFEPHPPMPFWEPHRRGFAAASLPWWLRPGPLCDHRQRHAGIVLVRASA